MKSYGNNEITQRENKMWSNPTISLTNSLISSNISDDSIETQLQQIKEELNGLTNNIEDSFYEKNADETVSYKMDIVKQYLNKLKEEVNGMSVKEAWQFLINKKNTAAWIMAVQIALESLNNPKYDVGRIDGIF